jgi:hypothetical protein
MTYLQYLIFLLQTSNCSKDKLFTRQDADSPDHRDTSDLVGTFVPDCNENQNYGHWELFAAQCFWYLKSYILSSFHIEGLHGSAITLSDFCRATRAVSTAGLAFPWR